MCDKLEFPSQSDNVFFLQTLLCFLLTYKRQFSLILKKLDSQVCKGSYFHSEYQKYKQYLRIVTYHMCNGADHTIPRSVKQTAEDQSADEINA